MVPAVLGLLAATILFISACICIKRIRQQNKKNNDASFPFQPTRRPTAVRSPSGAPPHYLKKSPSPTAPKPLPGASLSPPEQNIPKYTEENELTPKQLYTESKTPEIESPTVENEDNENGKLGTLVFKLRFLSERSALVVSVVRCRGLPGRNSSLTSSDIPSGTNGKIQNATDPYVKLQLLPEKQHKVKTRYDFIRLFFVLNLRYIR